MAKVKFGADVQNVIDVYRHTVDAWALSREDSLTCYNFCMNNQWTAREKAKFLKEKRPPIVYNMLLPRIHNLVGTEQLNRRSIKIVPSNVNNLELSNTLNGLWRSIWETEEAEFETERVFIDGLIMKIPGCLRIDVEPNYLGQYEYRINSVNPMGVFFDPGHRRSDLKDCGWIIQENWLNRDQIIDTYGKKLNLDEGAFVENWWEEISNRVKSLFGYGDTGSDWYDKDGEKYKVLEMQRRVKEQRELFADMAGNFILVKKSEAKKYKEANPESQFLTTQEVDRIRITTVCPYIDEVLVDEPYFIETDMYNIIPYYSFDYNNVKSSNNSLVYALLDPQRNLNKREIQKSAYIDHSINAPVMFSIEDKEAKDDFEMKGNQPGLGLTYRNYNAKPFRLQPANLSMDVWNDIGDSVDKMNDISGVNDTARGQSEFSNESGRLYAMKAERLGATVNPYFRNLAKFRKMAAEYFLKTVSQVYSDEGRVIDVMDRTNSTKQVVIDSITSRGIIEFEGRVVLDEAEHSPNMLRENLQTKLALAQSMPPELVNWAWILKDIELTDVQEQIDYINSVLGIQQQQASEDRALAQEAAITEQVIAEQQAAQPAPRPNNNGSKQ